VISSKAFIVSTLWKFRTETVPLFWNSKLHYPSHAFAIPVKEKQFDSSCSVPQDMFLCGGLQIEGVSAKPCQVTIWVKKTFCKRASISACGPQCNRKTWSCIFVAGFCFVFESKCTQKTWLFLAMSLGVYLLNSKQADCL